eukprot:TRINITY_DN32776_c0_g1_i3.p2 TRINITY_DN32776_c0_g1~~TRINITY_DN32776_c0_g1_i3.p2  ORF type:complete len:144 (+),score=25.31 TRINITY_DN32776_c0_g1_i3:340-771(+)
MRCLEASSWPGRLAARRNVPQRCIATWSLAAPRSAPPVRALRPPLCCHLQCGIRPVKSALKNRWLPQRTLCSGVCFDTENVEIYEVSPRASKAALDLAVPPVPDDWLSSLQLGSDSSYDDKVAMEAAAALACVFQGALIPRPL